MSLYKALSVRRDDSSETWVQSLEEQRGNCNNRSRLTSTDDCTRSRAHGLYHIVVLRTFLIIQWLALRDAMLPASFQGEAEL
jgi:hypothetical protein